MASVAGASVAAAAVAAAAEHSATMTTQQRRMGPAELWLHLAAGTATAATVMAVVVAQARAATATAGQGRCRAGQCARRPAASATATATTACEQVRGALCNGQERTGRETGLHAAGCTAKLRPDDGVWDAMARGRGPSQGLGRKGGCQALPGTQRYQ